MPRRAFGSNGNDHSFNMSYPGPASSWDVIIIGGGPAGLSAALMLARACRAVLVVDAGKPRNRASHHVHGFLSRDGIAPAELLSICREQLAAYPQVKFLPGEVTSASQSGDVFRLITAPGERVLCTALLLAQGTKDTLPSIEGLDAFYGTAVHHCPFCDAWEHRGQKLVAYGNDDQAAELARELLCWSRDVTLITDEAHEISAQTITKLKEAGARVAHAQPVAIHQHANRMESLHCADGSVIPCDALFFISQEQCPLSLVRSLGCRIEEGCAAHGKDMQTSVPGVFVAGNNCHGRDMVAMAAAQGATAAIGINDYLVKQGKFYTREPRPKAAR